MKRPARGSGAHAPIPASAPAREPGLLDALRDRPVLAGLALLVVARAVFWALIPTANEDAYITFRFARNLVMGLGGVFNPGERVMGFTSPLWTLWCALGMKLFGDPVPWTRVSSMAADMLTLVTLTALLLRHASRASAWCFALVFACWPFYSAVAVSGMESSAFVALLALAGWQVAVRSRWAALSLGLLALMRPEATVCAVVLAVWAPWRTRLIALALAAAGIAALALHYGSPIPQSVHAKALVYGMQGPLGARAWWEWIVPFDLFGRPTQADTLQLWTLRLVLGPGAVAGAWALRRTRALPFALAGLAVWLGYLATGTAFFFWYLLVPAVTVMFLACAGLPRVLRGPTVYVAAALLVAGTWTYGPFFYYSRAGIEGQTFGDAGMFLQRNARAGEVVLAEPIGIVGWINPSLIVRDEVGLVTPWVAERRTRGAGWYADAVERFEPRWLVVRGGFLFDQTQFAGRAAPFRDTTEFRARLSRYRLAFTSKEPLGPNDIAVLVRR